MAGSRQTIRTVRPSKVAELDDQLWPINCVILILAGSVTGVVIATSEFDDPRILYNGWARLFSVAVMVGLLFWGVMWLQGKMLRRLQLCLLISLLAHLCLAVYLHEQYLRLTAEWDAKSEDQVIEQYEQITVPDYYWQQIEQPQTRQSFEEPIETEAPRPTDPEAVQREAREPEMPTEIEPVEEPEIPQRQQPNPALARRAELSAPRRADAAAGAQISRREREHRASLNELIPEPEITPQPRRTAAIPDANIGPREQQETQVRVDQRQPPEEFSSEQAEQVEVMTARRATRPEPLPEVPTTPTPTHSVGRLHAPPMVSQVSPLAEIPRTGAATLEPVEVARRPPTVPPNPAERMIARREADVPGVVRPTSEPMPTPMAPNLAAQAAARPRWTEQVAQLAEALRAAPVLPRASRPARIRQPQQALLALTPRIAQAPIPAEAGPSNQLNPAIVRPTVTALSRGAERSTGVPQVEPAGRALPAISYAAQLPSTLASRRATASQQQPAGTDTAPARPTSLTRFDRGVSVPSSAIPTEVQPAATPAATGGTPASRVEVVSGVAVLRSAAEPGLGGGTGAAGTADFALGSTQIVARAGQPRSAGIGRPSATANAPVPRISRAAGPAAPTAASGIPETAPAIPGAVASRVTAPSTPSFNIQDSATRRGGTVRPFAAQATIGAGPTGSSGTPGPVGTAQSSRVTRHESVASAVAGGGTPKPGRTVGGDVTPSTTAETTELATAAPSGGRITQASPWEAQVSGPRRRISGLPGGLQSQPMAGALASLGSDGAPLPGAVARRATASRGAAGGRDIRSAQTVTLRRAGAGTDLPAAAVPVENLPKAGAGGVADAQGGLPSSLEAGLSATVRRAAADLSVGQVTAATGTSQSALGSANLVTVVGQTRVIADDVPAPAAGATTPEIGRRAVAAPAIAPLGPLQPEPVAKALAGGPMAEAGGLPQAAGGAPAAAVARGASGLTAAQPAEQADALAARDGRAIAVAHLSPANRDDTAAAAGRRRLPQDDGPSPTAEVGRGPLRRTDPSGLPGGLADAIAEPPVATIPSAGHLDVPANGRAAAPGDAIGATKRIGLDEFSREEGGLPVEIAAKAGPGGLGYLPSPEVGIPSRRARPESEVVHAVFRRFVIQRSGGRLAIDGRVREPPAGAFRQRDPGRRAQVAQAWGGSEGTEKAVEMGLDYFARHQFPDGHWSLHVLPEGTESEDAALGQMEGDSAATGLALLTFLGAGYTHLDDKHRAVVGRGIDWLVRNQKPDGDLFTGGAKYTWFYSHGIAAIALCEAYGMTQDPGLREPARKAIDFIIKTQDPTRGGWRYQVRQHTGRSTETDTSVTGWMLMALKSAQMAGLEVPDEVLKKIDAWLDTAQAPSAGGQYVYNPRAMNTPEQRHGLKPNLAMTSEAMLMRMYLGYQRDDPGLIEGAEHLKNNLPEVGTKAKPLRDCYYWYYATQAMFQMQDDYWTAWNDRLRPLLQSSQVQLGESAGSWDPHRPIPDRWGHAAGRHYVTALHLLMLEVYYRHLPLFQELSK